MNFGQAVKMAFKSLGSSKLRTFLTMLGVIIGVTCVALLTTVTSGAKDYIVGTLQKESQLVNMMMLGSNITKSKLDDVASGISKDITGEFSYTTISQGQAFPKMNGNFKTIPASTNENALYKRDLALGTSIIATSPLYDDVRNIELVGRFMNEGETDKCTVNQEFLDTFYPKGTKPESLLGTTIELYAQANIVRVEIVLAEPYQTPNTIESLILGLANYKANGAFLIGTQIEGSELDESGNVVLKENWFNKYSGFYVKKNAQDNWCIMLDMDMFYKTDAEIEEEFNKAFASMPGLQAKAYTLEAARAKTFTIVGVIVSESSMFNSMTDLSFVTQPNLVEIMQRMDKGSVGVLLCQENMMFLSDPTIEVAPENFGDRNAATLTPSSPNFELTDQNYPSFNEADVTIGLFRFEDEEKVEAGAAQIMSAMVTNGYMPDKFVVVSMNTIAGMVSSIMNIMTIMLSVIAGISLVVGGIGIMNIMLVTVSERTREIGIRKAIGAKRSSILMQFLVEALIVTMIGGLIGIILSLMGNAIIGNVMGISLLMPFWVFALSFGFSIAVGVIFGMYPAIKAARMHPIDALRHD